MKEDALKAYLEQLVHDIGAERGLVLQNREGKLEAPARFGFEPALLEDLPISFEMLHYVRQEGTPLLMLDARDNPDFRDRWSVMVSEIRSVVCVPFWNQESQVAGVIYADCCSRAGVFGRRELDLAQLSARKLEQELFGAPAPREAPADKPAAPKFVRQRPRPAVPPQAISPRLGQARPQRRAILVFYRCLAVMVGAGLTLSRSLNILGKNAEDKRLGEICGALEERLLTGSTLSAAMALFPRAFSNGNVKLVKIAENAGSLHKILERVAHHEEKLQDSGNKLLSSLTYPAIVLALTLLMLLIVPPYVLEGQFRLVRESGVVPPLPTRILMTLSAALGHPLTWVALGLCVAALGWAIRWSWSQPVLRNRIYERLLNAPLLGRVLQLLSTARFTQSLALMCEVGVPLTDGLTLAAASSLNPLLESRIGEAVGAVREGASLADALGSLHLLSGGAIETVRAGETTGTVAVMLGWCARLCEEELELAMATYLSLVEPILMLIMGIVVGGMLLATLLPMVGLLQNL